MALATAAQVIEAARALKGTRFRHRGRGADGADCGGLLIAVGEALGLQVPGPLYYERLPQPGLLVQWLAEYCVPVSEPLPGGVVQLLWAGRPQHLAIVGERAGGELTLIHSAEKLGGVVEHGFVEHWQRRVVSCWRMKGVI